MSTIGTRQAWLSFQGESENVKNASELIQTKCIWTVCPFNFLLTSQPIQTRARAPTHTRTRTHTTSPIEWLEMWIDLECRKDSIFVRTVQLTFIHSIRLFFAFQETESVKDWFEGWEWVEGLDSTEYLIWLGSYCTQAIYNQHISSDAK